MEPKDIRQEASTIINQEVQRILPTDFDETTAQQKSQELSHGKRSLPAKAVLHAVAPAFDSSPFIEWVSRDKAGGYHAVLQRGKPSRLFTKSITQEVNWPLFVLSRLHSPAQGIQIYQDKGPRVRSKAKGKGNKGKGKGPKGKGKQAKGGKAAKGGDPTRAMDES